MEDENPSINLLRGSARAAQNQMCFSMLFHLYCNTEKVFSVSKYCLGRRGSPANVHLWGQ